MASLFVIQGADQGKRFEFTSGPVAMGRDNSNAVQVHDNEVSRRHAELRVVPGGFELVDLRSANGTFVNDHPVDRAALRHGDKVQLGQTVMEFHDEGTAVQRDLRFRVDLLARSSPDDRSAILRSIPSGEGSRVLQAPDAAAAGWLRERLMPLSVMYRATQAISNILDIDALSPQILELVFESIGADRGAILLKDESGHLVPKAVQMARPGAARRADDHLADHRRVRPREGRRRDHDRRAERQAVQSGPIHRRLPDPRSDLRADPGAAYHAGRALRGHPGRAPRSPGSPPAQRLRAPSSPRTSSC